MSADLRGTIILNRMRHKYKLSSAMYWMAVTSQTEFDEGYDPASPQIRRLIDYLHDDGIEIGVHPSYYAFDKPEVLRKEISYLRSLLPFPIRGSRQHFLRWAPRTWAELETSGLMYDSSVGYHDVIGFRAGTSLPYRPWFIDQNRPANLVEVPLLVMDHTIQERMALSPEHALHRVRDLLTRCRMAGGVFTMLWHNTTIQLPRYAAMRKAMLIPLLEEIAGSPGYDVEKDLGNILVPSFIDNKRT